VHVGSTWQRPNPLPDPPPRNATRPPTHLHRALLVQAALLHALLQCQHLFALDFLLLIGLQRSRKLH
jgi:hypothetical protein